jgi:hypothetical protein
VVTATKWRDHSLQVGDRVSHSRGHRYSRDEEAAMQVVWKQRGVMVEAGALTATLEMLGCARKPVLRPDSAPPAEPC